MDRRMPSLRSRAAGGAQLRIAGRRGRHGADAYVMWTASHRREMGDGRLRAFRVGLPLGGV
eukprot:6555049-Prymnesium_polylepis.3